MEPREEERSPQPKIPLRKKTLACKRRRRQPTVFEASAAINVNTPTRPYIPPYMRRKKYVELSAPDYGNCNFLYTIKLHHGGCLRGMAGGNVGYLGGTITAFDFIDVTRTNFDYLDNLAEKLGYSGAKVYYGLGKSGMLEVIHGTFDIEHIFNAVVDRLTHFYLSAFRDK